MSSPTSIADSHRPHTPSCLEGNHPDRTADGLPYRTLGAPETSAHAEANSFRSDRLSLLMMPSPT